MKLKLRLIFLIALVACAAAPASAQRVIWNLDFSTRFDNREYKSELAMPQTLFGLKLVPELGLEWGRNALLAGVDVTRNFGGKKHLSPDPELILYYRYEGDVFDAYAGIFRRNKMWGANGDGFPTAFVSDSTAFYDANLEGVLLRYHGRLGHIEMACDWHSMFGKTQHEKFTIFSSGRIGRPQYYAGYYLTVFHYAGSEEVHGVIDNILGYPFLGTKLSLDSRGRSDISVHAGWLQAYQWDRNNEDVSVKPGGFMGEVNFRWRSLSIHNTIYAGDNLMPYYDRYGTGLYMGDPFFRTEDNIYNRLEIGWAPIDKDDMRLKVSSVHHYDGRKWNWQQAVSFIVSIGRETFRK